MSCGNTILKDPTNKFWVLSADSVGNVVVSFTPQTFSIYFPPILSSASFFWQLSADVFGNIVSTQVASDPTATASLNLTSSDGVNWSMTIDDTGDLITTRLAPGVSPLGIPFPLDINMSVWPNVGLTSTLTGNSPLTVCGDFSIWSCLLNKFINEDTTNIIVVLDE